MGKEYGDRIDLQARHINGQCGCKWSIGFSDRLCNWVELTVVDQSNKPTGPDAIRPEPPKKQEEDYRVVAEYHVEHNAGMHYGYDYIGIVWARVGMPYDSMDAAQKRVESLRSGRDPSYRD